MKAQVMKKAWEIFTKENIKTMAAWSQALKKAWSIMKGGEKKKYVSFEVRHQPSGGKEWVAEIVGTHPKFKFDRQFETPIARDWSSSGKKGKTTFSLEVGKVYEVNEPWVGRYFVVATENDQVLEISVQEVLAKIA